MPVVVAHANTDTAALISDSRRSFCLHPWATTCPVLNAFYVIFKMNMKRAQCSHQADTFFKVQVFATTFVSATITFSTSEVWKDKNY